MSAPFLIAEQIFLLLTNDQGDKETWVNHRRYALSAAVMLDLAAYGAVTFSNDRQPRVIPTGTSVAPLPAPVLAEPLARIQRRPNRRAQHWIADNSLGRVDHCASGLVSRGVLEERNRGFLFVQWNQYPTRDASVEQRLRARLQQVLHGQAPETAQEAMVLLLIDAIGARPVLKTELSGMRRGDVRRSIDEMRYTLVAPELGRTPPHIAHAVACVEAALRRAVQAANSSG